MRYWVRLLDGAVAHASDVIVALSDDEDLSAIEFDRMPGVDGRLYVAGLELSAPFCSRCVVCSCLWVTRLAMSRYCVNICSVCLCSSRACSVSLLVPRFTVVGAGCSSFLHRNALFSLILLSFAGGLCA